MDLPAKTTDFELLDPDRGRYVRIREFKIQGERSKMKERKGMNTDSSEIVDIVNEIRGLEARKAELYERVLPHIKIVEENLKEAERAKRDLYRELGPRVYKSLVNKAYEEERRRSKREREERHPDW